MPVLPMFVQPDWYKTTEGKDVFTSLMYKNMLKRKPFGLLERPLVPSYPLMEEFAYKIFVSGKSGVGKTSTTAKLSGHEVPTSHSETPGIQTSAVYWPAKMADINKVIMFKLQFWDAGEIALKKFDHILPACRERADGMLFVFSSSDKSSFADLPQQMSRVLDPLDNVCKFVIGTKLDLHSQGEVSKRDIQEFELHWKLPVFSIRNIRDSSQGDSRSDMEGVAPILNFLCDELWKRDQILAGRVSAAQIRERQFSRS